MSASLPFLSVIVPARQRPQALIALLGALEEQSYPPYRFEVLVCDDGSLPPLAEHVPIKACAFSVRFLRAPHAGPAAARNRGVREARGSIVCFTHDDCLPEPTWLEAIADALSAPGAYAVSGPVRASETLLDPLVHALGDRRDIGVTAANMAVRKEPFLSVAGYDETFDAPCFEDDDLVARLEEAYGAIGWSDEVRVEQPARPTPLTRAWRKAGLSRYLPYMRRKHPGFRPSAMSGVRRRALASGFLVLVGLAPLFGAPLSLALAWVGLFAWQAQQLQGMLKLAVASHRRMPLGGQLAFVGLGWTLDWVRWGGYVGGRGLHARPQLDEDWVLE